MFEIDLYTKDRYLLYNYGLLLNCRPSMIKWGLGWYYCYRDRSENSIYNNFEMNVIKSRVTLEAS